MNNNSQHKNSRLITIFRANNFVLQAQNPDSNIEVADWMSLSNKNIGPYFESNSAGIIGSGMTEAEKRVLLPYVIQVIPTDTQWPKASFDYFNSLVTKIPFVGGKTFQIGLTIDNDQPVSIENIPLNIEHYIRWRHAKNHPWMAGSRSEASGNQLKYFYMDDPEITLKEDTDKLALQDKADGIWLSVKDQSSKVSMLLTLMGGEPREHLGLRNAEARMRNDLRKRITSNPTKFLEFYEDKHFETRYWLKAMLNAAVVKKFGDAYVYGDSRTILGYSEDDVVLFLQNPKNEDTLILLKTYTQDILKKPKTGKTPVKK
jgi:hypothetical protein